MNDIGVPAVTDPSQGASPRPQWHENKSHFTIPQHFTYQTIIDNDLSFATNKSMVIEIFVLKIQLKFHLREKYS